jgi:hypothetical protein
MRYFIEFEKQTIPMSKIFGLLSNLASQFQGMLQSAFRTALQFVAHGPMVRPHQVLRPLRRRVDQHHGPLKVIQQNFVWLFRQLLQQSLKKPLRLVRVSTGLEEDERFPQFYMPGTVDVKLANYHPAAENQQPQEKEKELVLPEKPHRHPLCLQDARLRNVNVTAGSMNSSKPATGKGAGSIGRNFLLSYDKTVPIDSGKVDRCPPSCGTTDVPRQEV